MAQSWNIGLDGRFYRRQTGGIGRYSQQLVQNMLKIDSQNQYFLFLTKQDLPECNLEAPNLKKILTDIPHYSLAEQVKLPFILRKYNLDLMHFLNFNLPIFYQGKFVVTIHDLTMVFYPALRRQQSKIFRQAFIKVLKTAIVKSQKIITASHCVKEDIIKYYGASSDKIAIIYEGASDTFGSASKFQQDKIKQKMAITKPFILFVSQWRPHKGLLQAIAAFEILHEKYYKSLQFVIAGKPNPDFPEIAEKIQASKHKKDIILPGFVADDDLPALYSAASVFIFPSFYEGFGLPPLEAMACGTPVCASNTSCMPEILGSAALYFNPQKPEDMAAKIKEALENQNLRHSLIARGFKQVKNYSFQKTAEETLNIYQKILTNR